jgi:formate hydrogenlyase subunit 6/NADH:ubiquinone oxidoreductase subunit I
MKLGVMLPDLIGSLFKQPATERYPYVRRPAPERLRGKLWYDPAKCTGCQLCVKDCPSDAITLITIDKAAKRYVLEYHVDRCTFCAQCVQNCRFSCIGMSSDEWELASLSKEDFKVYFGRNEDITALMERTARGTADEKE